MARMTILSAGAFVVDILGGDSELAVNCNKIFPIVSEAGARLPYICYRRAGLETRQYKGGTGISSANTANFEVFCYAETEEQSLIMAERVVELLDGFEGEYTDERTGDHLVARSITLTEADEFWQDDAYCQNLTFQIKI